MTTKNMKLIIGVAAALTLILVTVGNGCSKRADYAASSGSAGTDAQNVFDPDVVNSPAAQNTDIIPGAKTASVISAKQSLDQLTACAGVRVASDDTIRMHGSKEGSISAYGSFNSVTAPMLTALINLSGEVCDDLIDQEIREVAAGRPARIFQGFNFAANNNALPAAGDVTAAIGRLAQSCWQKQETNVERTEIQSMLSSIPAGAGASRRQALMLCTSMLASLKSVMN